MVSLYLSVGNWTGKAVLFHLVLPLLFAKCIDIVNEKVNAQDWILIGVIAVAGVTATVAGLYTVPICCGTIKIPYIVWLIIKKRGQYTLELLQKCFVSMSGVIAIGIYSIVCAIGSEPGWTESLTPTSAKVLLTRASDTNKMYVVCFIIAVVLIMILEKNKKLKWLSSG